MSSADKNILPLSFDTSATSNYSTVAQFVTKIAPRNVNITGGVPSGDVVFELSTGANTYLDLYKSYISMRFEYTTVDNAKVYFDSMMLLRCMFQRAVVRLNGRTISSSNNYTADSIISARLSGGYDYNKNNNGFYDIPDIPDNDTNTQPNSRLTSIDRLDALWLRTPEGLIVPPNTQQLTFEFTIDSNYLAKAMIKTVANGVTGAIRIIDFNFHATTYVNPTEATNADHVLRFCNIKSFLSSVDSETVSRQYTVSPAIMKAVVAHYAPGYANTAGPKWQTAYLFNGASDHLQTLQFRLGNINVPVSAYNFKYGYREAYEDYVANTNQLLKDSGKENYEIWEGKQVGAVRNNWGKIIVGNIVKPPGDTTNTLEVQTSYEMPGENQAAKDAASAAFVGTMIYIASIEEQVVGVKETATGIDTIVTK